MRQKQDKNKTNETLKVHVENASPARYQMLEWIVV